MPHRRGYPGPLPRGGRGPGDGRAGRGPAGGPGARRAASAGPFTRKEPHPWSVDAVTPPPGRVTGGATGADAPAEARAGSGRARSRRARSRRARCSAVSPPPPGYPTVQAQPAARPVTPAIEDR